MDLSVTNTLRVSVSHSPPDSSQLSQVVTGTDYRVDLLEGDNVLKVFTCAFDKPRVAAISSLSAGDRYF